jgi:hypothetical protein
MSTQRESSRLAAKAVRLELTPDLHRRFRAAAAVERAAGMSKVARELVENFVRNFEEKQRERKGA